MLACWRVIGCGAVTLCLLPRSPWETRPGRLRLLVCHTALYRLAVFTVFTVFSVRMASVVATALCL